MDSRKYVRPFENKVQASAGAVFPDESFPLCSVRSALPTSPEDQKYPSLITTHFKQRLRTGWPSLESYRPTLSQIRSLEHDTKSQFESELWFQHRAGRITASRVHKVVFQSTAEALLEIFEKKKNLDHLEHVVWGRVKEKVARDVYVSKQRSKHIQFRCSDTGLLIDIDKPFLGASSDGVVSCTCCGKGVLEIKCPYRHRNDSIQEALNNPYFCLDYSKSLKRSHRYFTQVQLQMHVHRVTYCDFFVYTTRDSHCCRVYYDKAFCNTLVGKSERFFKDHVLPAVQSNKWQ